MTLTKRKVTLIVAMVVVSLSGLILVQIILLGSAMESKEQSFRRNVFAALDLTVRKLEAKEATTQIMMFVDSSFVKKPGKIQMTIATDCNINKDSIFADSLTFFHEFKSRSPIEVEGDTMYYTVQSPQKVTISILNLDSGTSSKIIDTFQNAGKYCIGVCSPDSNQIAYQYESDSGSFVFKSGMGGSSRNPILPIPWRPNKVALVQRVLARMMTDEFVPIKKRLREEQLDSLLSASLIEQGIDLKYGFGVSSISNDSLQIVQPPEYQAELRRSDFRTRLFPQDLISAPSDLILYFPDRVNYLWRQMVPIMSATTLFVFVIVFCFIYAVRVILRQRRFASQMTDFINNMTHEFKTPISTVALACEAIARPDVIGDANKVTRFNRMIQDETTRMRTQVDRILQMAVLEEGDYELNLSEIDCHKIIEKAVENIALHIESRGGNIKCDLRAENPVILADKVHLTNIIHNLLDNANKYSPEKPLISISSNNIEGGILLNISDNGVGLSEEDQKHVFDKYYRVASGNIHNIKGFGLGLAYVKLMVAAHGGRINLQSQLGQGTTLELFLPSDGPKENEK
jgi:two-component system, OmpR family, phosphate regulon sensor histidine kinase PhoR